MGYLFYKNPILLTGCQEIRIWNFKIPFNLAKFNYFKDGHILGEVSIKHKEGENTVQIEENFECDWNFLDGFLVYGHKLKVGPNTIFSFGYPSLFNIFL